MKPASQSLDVQKTIDNMDYDSLIETFGYDVLVQRSSKHYQGVTLLLLRDPADEAEPYGLLRYDWGSCCGCDALADVRDASELDSLQRELHNAISWFPSIEDATSYIVESWLKDDYLYEKETHLEFFKAVVAIANEQT